MFQGIVIDKDETGQQARLQTLDDAQLPAGNVTIRVGYSTLNYKDGLAITGKAGGPQVPDGARHRSGRRSRSEHAPGLSPRRPGRAQRLGRRRNALGRPRAEGPRRR